MALSLLNLQFGLADAESESTLDGGEFLPKVFFDPFNTDLHLSQGKFVIAGKKGTGKSEFLYALKLNPKPNRFLKIIKFKDFELQGLIQDLNASNDEITQKAIWKWILLCNLLEQLASDLSIRALNSVNHDVGLAMKRISGYTSVDGLQIREQVRKTGGQVEISPFKGIAKAVKSTSFETRETAASLFALLPRFERLILDVIRSARDSKNSFLIGIDDLDEGFGGTGDQKDSIRTLLKVAKELHTTFNSEGLLYIPIILIRQDILNRLNIGDANLHKIISNNTQKFDWFSNSSMRSNYKTPLLTMVSQRIKYSYQKAGLSIPVDPAVSIFDDDFYNWAYNGQVFKFILDGTLYRPRDIITIYNALRADFPNHNQVSREEYARTYRKRYSFEKMREWEGELKASLGDNEVRSIMAFFKTALSRPFTLGEVANYLKSNDEVAHRCLEACYEAGMVANIHEVSGQRQYNWVFRTEEEEAIFRPEMPLVVHQLVKERHKSWFG